MLLAYGKDDAVVPNKQTLAFARAMHAAEKPVEVLELPDKDHRLSRDATRIKMLEASVAFVEKYNPLHLRRFRASTGSLCRVAYGHPSRCGY